MKLQRAVMMFPQGDVPNENSGEDNWPGTNKHRNMEPRLKHLLVRHFKGERSRPIFWPKTTDHDTIPTC